MLFTLGAVAAAALSPLVSAAPAVVARASTSGCTLFLNSTRVTPASPAENILMSKQTKNSESQIAPSNATFTETMIKWNKTTSSTKFMSVSIPAPRSSHKTACFMPKHDAIKTKLTENRATATGTTRRKHPSRSSSTPTLSRITRRRMSWRRCWTRGWAPGWSRRPTMRRRAGLVITRLPMLSAFEGREGSSSLDYLFLESMLEILGSRGHHMFRRFIIEAMRVLG